MKTTSDDLEILDVAVRVYSQKLDSVRAYMVSYGVPWESHIQKLDIEAANVKKALKNVMADWLFF